MAKWVAAVRRLRERCGVKFLAVKNFFREKQEGASLVEYALLVALIALACIVAIEALGGGISNAFNNIKSKLGNKV
jgi:pilus assembly protein Flp/PilA